MQELLVAMRKLSWALAIIIALIAAFVFRQGYQEVAALIWLLALVLVLPMWSQSK